MLAEFCLSLFIGKYPIKLADLQAGDVQAWNVFFTLRLPRTCMAAAGGFGLGAAGEVYQMVFRNPLAAPDVVGVSSGASAGAAAAILFLSAAPGMVAAGAFVGGLLAVLLALGLPHEIAHGSLRLTLSEENTEEDIEYIINAVAEVVETVRGISSFWDDLQSGKIKHFI